MDNTSAAVASPPTRPSSVPEPRGDDLGPSLRIGVWLMMGMSLVFLATRLYCKIWRRRPVQPDDWLLIVSWVMLLVAAVGVTVQTFHGLGSHIWEAPSVSVGEINSNALTGLLCVTFTICSSVWSKTSWGITLLRISDGKPRMLVWFIIISMNVLFAATAMVYWIPCTPVEKAWRPLTPGVCVDPKYGLTLGIVASIYSGIGDLTFAILPWWILRSLRMQPAEKIGVAVAMSMGLFAAICAFVKASALPTLSDLDFPYTTVPLTLWSAAEPAVTIMAASLPMMRVLIQTCRQDKGPSGSLSSDTTAVDRMASPLDRKMEV